MSGFFKFLVGLAALLVLAIIVRYMHGTVIANDLTQKAKSVIAASGVKGVDVAYNRDEPGFRRVAVLSGNVNKDDAEKVRALVDAQTGIHKAIWKGQETVVATAKPTNQKNIVKDYQWKAEKTADGKILLTGFVPDEATRQSILTTAKSIYTSVDDKMNIAPGAPRGWLGALEYSLRSIKALRTGAATLSNNVIKIDGVADTDAVRAAIDAGLRSASEGFTASSAVQLAKSLPEPVKTIVEPVKPAVVDAPKAALEVAKPVEALKPVETPKPVVEAPKPVETPKPVVEAPKPVVEEKPFQAKVVSTPVRDCQKELDALLKGKTIEFNINKAELRRVPNPLLDDITVAVMACGNVNITVFGHTDKRGNPDANKALSQERANRVVEYLIASGIAPQKLKAVGMGSEKLINMGDSVADHQQNRRIEFSVSAAQ